MNIKKSMSELEAYFQENAPKIINYEIKRAALNIATVCAHPSDLSAEDMEEIALPLQHLSNIMEIIDRYEDKDK